MTLPDAAIDRYSRQILVPDIGGTGQERLLAARVVVRGDGAAAMVARDLLDRAGVGDGVPADVLVALDRNVAALAHGATQDRSAVVVVAGVAADGLVVAVQPGHPCPGCVGASVGHLEPAAGAARALALGALAAGVTLHALLHPMPVGRITRVPGTGSPHVADLAPPRVCDARRSGS